jgi:hypothetical protein
MSMVVDRMVKPDSVEVTARSWGPKMTRMMDKLVSGVTSEHACGKTICEGWSESGKGRKGDDEDQGGSDARRCADVGSRVCMMGVVVPFEDDNPMVDRAVNRIFKQRPDRHARQDGHQPLNNVGPAEVGQSER